MYIYIYKLGRKLRNDDDERVFHFPAWSAFFFFPMVVLILSRNWKVSSERHNRSMAYLRNQPLLVSLVD